MALILNIETATTVCSVALAKDGEVISAKELNNGYTHSENLTVFIDELMNQAALKYSDLDAIAVSKGPGSYTGLRIGVSTAKGLCYALSKPLIAVETLKHFSLNISKVDKHINSLFCPMIDARRMEVYCAVYNSKLEEVEPVQAKIIDENSFANLLKTKKILFFGDGATKCFSELGVNPNAEFLNDIVLSAKDMVIFSEAAFNENQFEDVAYFEPYYLKDFIPGPKKESVVKTGN